MTRLACPHCRAPVIATPDLAGWIVRCGGCEQPFRVPAHQPVAALAPADRQSAPAPAAIPLEAAGLLVAEPKVPPAARNLSAPLAFLKFVAKAALNAVGGGIAGDFAVEVVPEIARDVWQWWGKDRPEDSLRAELQGVAQLPADEARRQAEALAGLEAAGRPEADRRALTAYLAQVPAAIRQSQRRSADPSGRTVASSLLPAKLPRFSPGVKFRPKFEALGLDLPTDVAGQKSDGSLWEWIASMVPSETSSGPGSSHQEETEGKLTGGPLTDLGGAS